MTCNHLVMQLEERFYTSTEVAEILGVSLRSIYRYLEEGKLVAEVKTATGRHRFTKQNILDFLYPDQNRTQIEPKEAEDEEEISPKVTVRTQVEEVEIEAESGDEEPEMVEQEEEAEEQEEDTGDKEVDWLEKFRAAAEKHRKESAEKQVAEEPVSQQQAESVSGLASEEEKQADDEKSFAYYKSGIGGLKDIAQNLDKSAKKASLDYSFTMNAGLSLHKPIKPFSVLHAYIRPQDLEYFEKMLQLSPASEGNAQLCLVLSDDDGVYSSSKEMHGLSVVSNAQLRQDLLEAGEEDLSAEIDSLSK